MGYSISRKTVEKGREVIYRTDPENTLSCLWSHNKEDIQSVYACAFRCVCVFLYMYVGMCVRV